MSDLCPNKEGQLLSLLLAAAGCYWYGVDDQLLITRRWHWHSEEGYATGEPPDRLHCHDDDSGVVKTVSLECLASLNMVRRMVMRNTNALIWSKVKWVSNGNTIHNLVSFIYTRSLNFQITFFQSTQKFMKKLKAKSLLAYWTAAEHTKDLQLHNTPAEFFRFFR